MVYPILIKVNFSETRARDNGVAMEIRSETEITPLRCSSIRILFGALDCRSELAALMASRVEGFGSVMWWGFSPSQDLGALANEGDLILHATIASHMLIMPS